MEVERVERAGLEAARARRELHLLDQIRDARHDRGLDDLATGSVDRCLGDVALRIDGPRDDEVALDPWIVLERTVVTGSRVIPARHDDGANVLWPPTDFVSVRSFRRR